MFRDLFYFPIYFLYIDPLSLSDALQNPPLFNNYSYYKASIGLVNYLSYETISLDLTDLLVALFSCILFFNFCRIIYAIFK